MSDNQGQSNNPYLFLCGTCVIGWYWYLKGQFFRKKFEYTRKIDQDLKETSSSIAEKNGKHVFVTGNLKSDSYLEDQDFDIKVNALALKRKVKMFQLYMNDDSLMTKSFKEFKNYSELPEGFLNPSWKFCDYEILIDKKIQWNSGIML